jgi:ApaG protein
LNYSCFSDSAFSNAEFRNNNIDLVYKFNIFGFVFAFKIVSIVENITAMPTVSKITQGILIQAEPEFNEAYSSAERGNYVFTYHIAIHNNTEFACQLLRRKWIIFDSLGIQSEVKGEGVIGMQPIIKPGEIYRYDSYCPLKTDIGYMKGSYQMKRLDNNSVFEVHIPYFELITPNRLN